MESHQFRSLVESVNNFLSGADQFDELQEAEEIVADYLDSWFGEDLTEDIEDESIEDALVNALAIAEAIEIVLSEANYTIDGKRIREFGKPARTASDLAQKASSGDYSWDQGTSKKEIARGKKVRDAAVNRATRKYGKVVGAAVKARAARSTHDAEYDSTGKSRRKMDKLDAFIKRRTGGK